MKTIRIVMMMALALAGATAFAQNEQALKIEVTPYIWLAGFEGDATVNGQKADFDKSFSDLVDSVDVGGSLILRVQYDRILFGFVGDYFSTDTDKMEVEDRPQGGRMETDFTLMEGAVGYQLDGFSEGQTFDVMIGVRFTSIDSTLTIKSDGTVHESDKELVDPMIMLRPSMPMFPSRIDGLRFNPTLAIGGGGDADLVYELFPQIQYDITENASIRFGYRTVGYKFEEGDNELNMSLSGLILGFGVKF